MPCFEPVMTMEVGWLSTIVFQSSAPLLGSRPKTDLPKFPRQCRQDELRSVRTCAEGGEEGGDAIDDAEEVCIHYL